jgi:C-terminal processing protease CtpA/Prc
MRQFTRRAVLAGTSAVAASSLSSILALRSAAGQSPCPTKTVKEFLADAKAQSLSPQQRADLVDQAIALLSDFYAHLPLKRALYGIDPLERLRLLRQRLTVLGSDPAFHGEMRDIFVSLRDLHTVYLLPEPYASSHAWLPFKVEACVESGRRMYIVSRVVDGFVHPTFGVGVEVLSFDGIPIARAAELVGQNGSTPAARQALGLARLTYRALFWEPPPREDSVLIHYKAGRKEYEISIPWSISTLPALDPCANDPQPCTEIQQLQKFRQFLYAPFENCNPFGVPERIRTPDGLFGYLRIFSFEKSLLGDDAFVRKFKGHVADLARDTKGLIIDVRDNGGGSTRAGERIIQFITPTNRQIEPSRLYFVANPVTLGFCQLSSTDDLGPNGLQPWIPSIQQAVQNHGTFSEAFQYTKDEAANEPTRTSFPGPVIVITSALSYSTAEFFAAGFQDHGGMIVGVDESTGGGGAGVRGQDQLIDYYTQANQPPPLQPLSRGGFTCAFRRSVRVGLGSGIEIEDRGVLRDRPYAMTRRDLLNRNQDLKREAARLLAQM